MLKRILVVIVLLFWQNIYAADDAPAHYKVIIIGAGAAGLEAGRYLEAHGVKDYIILEARDRIGGRVNTVAPWKNVSMELGAAMIHGTSTENPLVKLIKEWKLVTVPLDDDSSAFYDWDGEEISDTTESYYQKFYSEFRTLLEQKRKDPEKNNNLSVADVVIELINNAHLNQDTQHGFLYEISDKIEQEYGTDIQNLSALWYDNEDAFPGGNSLLVNGYNQLINGIAKGMNARILLNHVVTKINYSDPKSITVTTANGKQFTGDYVICTLPLGVLKSGKVQFEPALPQEKITAMSHLNMGLMNKVFMLFPKVFWDTELYISYVSPAYWSGKEWVNKNEWIEFDNLNANFHQPILSAVITGSFAQNLENKTDTEIIHSVMATLRTIYDDDIPEPTSYVITRWGKDPYSFGSYSSLRPGALTDGDDYLNMAKTVANRLLFAGEATTNVYPSTVYGAYLSGDRAAKEILSHK